MPLPNILALLVLLVGVPLNAIVTVMLFRRSRKAPTIKVLRERMVVSAVLLLALVVFGLIFLNNDTLPPPFDVYLTKVVSRSAMLVLAIVPAAYWLYLYWIDTNGRS
jgi:hypothetical protein